MMNSRRQLFFILLVCLGAIVFYSAFRNFSKDEKADIRRIVYTAAAVIERGRSEDLGGLISDSYSDPENPAKKDLLARLERIFKMYPSIKVKIKGLVIMAEPLMQADIGFAAYFTKQSDDKIYYDSGKLKVYFKKENKEWKITLMEYMSSQDMLILQEVA